MRKLEDERVTTSSPGPDPLLTARQLVGELARLGAGDWGADAVRQWIREERPCPIAAAGVNGQPHRYRVQDVLAWLLARTQRERGKTHTRADGADPAAVLQQALARARAESPVLVAGASAPEGEGAAVAEPEGLGRNDPDIAALARALGLTPRALSRALDSTSIVVSRWRDPRNAKAHEEMRLARLRADEAEGKLVPVGEVDRLLQELVLPVRSALLALPAELSRALEACVTDEARRNAIQVHVDSLLLRLSSERVPGAGAEDAPP